MFLYSLPPSFENFRCAIESRDDLPSPDILRIKIVEESDARKNDARNAVQNTMIAKRSNMNKERGRKTKSGNKEEFKFHCHRCKEKGHKAVDCKNKRREDSRQSANNIEETILYAVEEQEAKKGARYEVVSR